LGRLVLSSCGVIARRAKPQARSARQEGESRWTQSIAVGDKSFLAQIKEQLGIRAKGRKIHGSEDEYQLREGQTGYGAWQDLDNENTFDWNLAN
jgi:hypothetical protein